MAPTYRSGSSYQSGSSAVTTVQLPKPTGVVAGDLLLALCGFLYTVNTPTETIAPPAGWTELQHSNATLQGFYASAITLFAKVADGSEPSTMNFVLSDGDDAHCLGVMLAIQDGGLGASAMLEENSPGNIVRTPAIAGGNNCLDIRMVIAMYNPGSFSAPAGYSLRQAAYTSYLGCPIGTATKSQATAGTFPQAQFALSGVSGMQVGFSVISRGPEESLDSATAAVSTKVEHWDQHLGSGTSHSDTNTLALALTGSSVDGMDFDDTGDIALALVPSSVDGMTYIESGTVGLKFTPITTHECRTKYVVTLEVLSLQSKWVNANTFNRYNNVVSDTKFYVGYVGVDPSVQDC